ncbi:SGNH/GDSL hydrolase family protein [Emticicia sp. BO119]|uniref:SGNH/GDSL hydrolase family protein n=1 Tax=Emticicia sp. BO119 TaxID=2757768 RepID=UPI0015F10F20|nr:SGNH/GDSL hydrolase family protein [Emticicia sp. BO119]MBA4849028.1 SGNH/GDSL hydrolase family protein [Emticicia sp. BO119]
MKNLIFALVLFTCNICFAQRATYTPNELKTKTISLIPYEVVGEKNQATFKAIKVTDIISATGVVDKLDKTGGIISGALTVNGSVTLNTKLSKNYLEDNFVNDVSTAKANAALAVSNTTGIVSGLVNKGNYDASINSPTLTTTPSTSGDFYTVVVAGTQSITGSSVKLNLGDRVVSNGTAWQRIPYEVILADHTVTTDKTSFILTGKNKFNKDASDNVSGYYIAYNSGVPTVNASYTSSGFISISPSTYYTTSSSRQLAYYDANRTYISGLNLSASTPTTFQTPSTAAYIRLSVTNGEINTFQLEEGSTATTYEAFSLNLAGSINANQLKDNIVNTSNLKDSVITAQKTNFISVGKNKFNILASDNISGYYLDNSNGNLIASGTYNTTGYIRIKSSTYYYPSFKHIVIFYDANKSFISGLSQGRTNTEFQTPSTAKYVRLVVNTSSWNAFQLEEGSTGTTFEPYALSFLSSIQATKIQDGLISTTKIQDNAVTMTKTNFFAVGKNKFNKDASDNVSGYYIVYNSGVPTVNATYTASGFIAIKPSTYYTINIGRQIAFYDASKVYISGLNLTGTNPASFQTPSTAVYIRLSITNAEINTYQLEEGSTATGFESFRYTLKDNSGTIPIFANSEATVNKDFIITPKYYIPSGKQLVVFNENIVNSPKLLEKFEVSISSANAKTTGVGLKYSPVSTGSVSGSAILGNDNFANDIVKSFTVVATDATATTAKKILFLGDSITWRSTHVDRLITNSGTGLTFVGTRRASASTNNILCEGRGGWSAGSFTTQNTGLWSPFMQPQDPYRYKGNTSFWIDANQTTPSYDADRFPDYKTLFNSTTGYPVSPATNDVIYDNTAATYKVYNGTSWVDISSGSLTFTFNVAKYRTVWSIAQPDIVSIMFGTNDFAGVDLITFATNYPAYKARLDVMIAGFKADNSSVKIILCIPPPHGKTSAGSSLSGERSQAALYSLAKNLITDYSGQEVSNVYLLDYFSTMDRIYGFPNTTEKNFNNYSGTAREIIPTDGVHPGPDGFLQMGDLLTGIIQFLR